MDNILEIIYKRVWNYCLLPLEETLPRKTLLISPVSSEGEPKIEAFLALRVLEALQASPWIQPWKPTHPQLLQVIHWSQEISFLWSPSSCFTLMCSFVSGFSSAEGPGVFGSRPSWEPWPLQEYGSWSWLLVVL